MIASPAGDSRRACGNGGDEGQAGSLANGARSMLREDDSAIPWLDRDPEFDLFSEDSHSPLDPPRPTFRGCKNYHFSVVFAIVVYVSELTVREAAEHLQVHQSRVRGLLSAGTLAGRRIGNQWLIELHDLERHRDLIRGGATSRAMSTRTAWAAGALLDGQNTRWLATSERARLAQRLLRHTNALQSFRRWLLTRQTSAALYRIADSDIEALLNEAGVVATGVSAARAYDLGVGAIAEADVYVTDDVARQLIKKYFLVRSERGNLTLRTVSGSWHTDTAVVRGRTLVTTRLLAAVDLLDQDDTRAANAGRRLLQDTLREFAHARSEANVRRAASEKSTNSTTRTTKKKTTSDTRIVAASSKIGTKTTGQIKARSTSNRATT
ncbi:MAG: helix-turn-helix domain-containing protein [Actinomycetota bacterium]|nr:helix-turn-helix domain-containing protein [Actinomycetota bacterium]